MAALLVLAVALVATPTAAAAPSCAEGPQIVGATYHGTPCADTIRAPRSVTTIRGEGGDDTLYGQRGNDTLLGGEGNDRLYGGVGDDELRGGTGADHLSGGFGADSLDGEAGGDFARGDATIDAIADTGSPADTDTLSYATGATPGFFDGRPGVSAYDGFPPSREGRGAYVNLQSGLGDNGLAPSGGGVDEGIQGTSFETVIGTAFPDFIVGTAGAETIYGGGGADAILGEGGADVAHGGADGDSCDAATAFECETAEEEVTLRDPGAISVGSMPGSVGPALYLTGSDEDDAVTATYAPGTVTFSLGAGSEAGFDTGPSADGGCADPVGGQVVCAAPTAPDSIVLAGMDGDDTLAVSGFGTFPTEATSVVLLGGVGDDLLTGASTEDALVDGAGEDVVDAAGRDDAVPNNGGADQLQAGSGEDLFVSNAVCDGDSLDGGPDRDNANWANFDAAIAIDMAAQRAGLVGPGGAPQCSTASLLTTLVAIEDTEGTSLGDVMLGDAGNNQLLGRPGQDSYSAAAGNDVILANSGDSDLSIECGEGFDTALIDFPANPDPAPVACEDVEERAPNSFRPPNTPPDPDPPNEPEPPAEPGPPTEPSSDAEPPLTSRPPPDRRAPATRIQRRPPRLLFLAGARRRVVFAFSAGERGASFRCRLDRQRFLPCRSPRAFLLAPGRHAFRVYAIDAAGNRDRSPAVFAFLIRRR